MSSRWPARDSPAGQSKFDQTVGFVPARDGVRIAYAESGRGMPLIKTANWLTHLEYDWRTPVWRHWLEFLSAQGRLVRYDERGNGLSDHDAADLSFARWVEDLEALVEHLGLERFNLLGTSQGGAVAIEYAARHPEKVERLVLHGAYARGWARRGDLEQRRGRALLELVEVGWGADNPAYRQIFTTLFVPDATEDQARWFTELQRVATEPAVAARLIEAAGQIDVTSSVSRVRAPTLVLHGRQDARVPFEEGRQLAASIPGARFVPLDTRNHALLEQDPEWERFKSEFRVFVRGNAAPAAASLELDAPYGALTAREVAVVQLLVEGLENREIARRLGITEKTVRNHLTRIFGKIGVRNRAQLIVRVRG